MRKTEAITITTTIYGGVRKTHDIVDEIEWTMRENMTMRID